MTRWWRAYSEAVDDPKLQRLSGDLFKAWFNLMCLAATNDGLLPPLENIAFKLRVSEAKAEKILRVLVDVGLLDDVSDGQLQPHNWNGRQYKSDVSTVRVKRFRKRSVKRFTAVSETPPETDTETEKKERPLTPSSSLRSEEVVSADDVVVVDEDDRAKLFRIGKTILVSFGVAEKRTGSLIGQWLKQCKDDAVGLLAAIQFARDQNIAEPVAYVSAMLKQEGGGKNGPESYHERGKKLADEWRRREREQGLFRKTDDA